MKKTTYYLLMLTTVLLTSCNLFIDEELEEQLIRYNGKGYDQVASETTESYSINYQYKSTTLELNADNPLTKHIVKVESDDSARCHVLYFDGSTPIDQLPKVGQCIVSNNLSLFPYGLCDMVGVVETVNGEHVLTCKGVDVKNAFEYLNFHASVPVDDCFDEYDILDGDGNVVNHVDNRERNARMKTTRSNNDEGSWLPVYIPFEIPHLDGYLDKQGSVSFSGSFQCKLYMDVDFDWDEGLRTKIRMKDGACDIDFKIQISKGTGMKKLFGNNDLLNGKYKIIVGSVVIVPVLGFSVNYKVDGALTFDLNLHKPIDFELGFDGSDFYSKDNSGPKTMTTKIDLAGTCEFPILKISVGFGLYTSDLSIRLETYAKLAAKINVASTSMTFSLDNDDVGPLDISLNPTFSLDLQMGGAVALVAKGLIISKVIEKIRKHVEEITQLDESMESYLSGGGCIDWIMYQAGHYDAINPSVRAEIEKALGNLQGDKRKQAIEVIIKRKSKELEKIKPLSDEAIDIANTRHVVKPEEADRNKEYALRMGPFYPDLLKWNLYKKTLFPKMRDGSFRVGRNWDSNKEKLVCFAEFILEDPGLLAEAHDYYPLFLIKKGNEPILMERAHNGEKISGDTPRGKKFTASFPGLPAGEVYSCVPGYAHSLSSDASIFDKAISFSTTTPTVNITKLEVTKNERKEQYDAEGNPIGVVYNYAFDTYTDVIGVRNVREWGIIDLNDTNEKTRVHVSTKNMQKGYYVHHWSVKNTKKSKIKVSLQPYLFAKDGNKDDWNEAKFFPRFDYEIKDEYDFSSRQLEPEPAKTLQDFKVFDDSEPVKAQLDSITCNDLRIL